MARISGPAAGLLIAERTMLNFLGHLSGVATLTHNYVTAVGGTQAQVYDTRKTKPGWRLLEKYAVRCGGGQNHRLGLSDSILIKDNHLAFGAAEQDKTQYTPAEAVKRAIQYRQQDMTPLLQASCLIEVEVDSLWQLEQVLCAGPEIVLLDNMQPEQLRESVQLRNKLAPHVLLEASGGVNLQTVRAIAESGVERISIGALTHSAVELDLGIDWE